MNRRDFLGLGKKAALFPVALAVVAAWPAAPRVLPSLSGWSMHPQMAGSIGIVGKLVVNAEAPPPMPGEPTSAA